jgi:hypothetical protein
VTMDEAAAKRAILFSLLEAQERSTSYGAPAPWPRDVILRFDEKTWPDAFAPNGREIRSALIEAAHALERAGALRITAHRGPASAEPRELRLGPGELSRAESIAVSFGFSPLRDALDRFRTAVNAARAERNEPAWLDERLATLDAGAQRADLTALGISRERFKRDQRDVVDALRTAVALWRGLAGWERVVSERIFGDSKRIAAVRGELRRVLTRLDPRFEALDDSGEELGDVLEICGLRRKPGVIACAGSASIQIGARNYELADFAPVAHLPESWSSALVDALKDRIDVVTTVENEVPFIGYVESCGGAVGLGAQRELVVYVAGFPAPWTTTFLAALRTARSSIAFRHWGDADLGGLRIWWFLRQRLGTSLQLFRTTAAWVEKNSGRSRSLRRQERGALARFRDDLAKLEAQDARDAHALADVLVRRGIKIEQERFSTEG